MYALGLVHSVDNILFTTNCREAVTQRQDAKRRLPAHRGAAAQLPAARFSRRLRAVAVTAEQTPSRLPAQGVSCRLVARRRQPSEPQTCAEHARTLMCPRTARRALVRRGLASFSRDVCADGEAHSGTRRTAVRTTTVEPRRMPAAGRPRTGRSRAEELPNAMRGGLGRQGD